MKKKCGGTSEEDLKNIEKDYDMLPKPVSSNKSMDLNDEDLDMLPDYESPSNKSIDLNDENLDMLPDYKSPSNKIMSKKFFPRPKLTEAQKDARNKRKEKLKVKKTHNKNKIRYQSRKKIADKRPRVKGRFIKTDKKIKDGGIGPNSDDRKYFIEMRKRTMIDSMNPGLPLDIAPGMKKKKSKTPKRSKSKKKSKTPPKKKSSPPKKKPSPPKPSQYNPLLQYQNLTPAQKKKYKREMIRTKRKASSRRTSGRNVTPFIRM